MISLFAIFFFFFFFFFFLYIYISLINNAIADDDNIDSHWVEYLDKTLKNSMQSRIQGTHDSMIVVSNFIFKNSYP